MLSRKSRIQKPLSPRISRLVRESWLLLVAVGIVYLALILITFNRGDPGWSQSGTGAQQIRNAGGPFGAWLADLLLSLFGFSAWWCVTLGLALCVLGYRRVIHADEETDHSALVGGIGFGLLLVCSAALESLRLYQLRAALPAAPGGIIGDIVGQAVHGYMGFNGGTLVLLALLAVGWSLFSGMSWLRISERIGLGIELLWQKAQHRRQARHDRRLGERAAGQRDAFIAVEKHRREEDPPLPIRIEMPVQEIVKSERVIREKQRPLFRELPDSLLPPLTLLERPPQSQESVSADSLEFTSRLIERKLADFGVEVKVLAAYPGPVITRYEIEPAVGVKGSQIVNLVRDLARALSVVSIRVVETIPGKSCMGLEIPNPKRQIVKLVEILESTVYDDNASVLTLALGKDIAGKPVVADLARMPHLLVAGTTGSGKSVALNAMILSLLYKAEPKRVRLLMIDPKMLELSVYEGIGHLLAPVVTDMKLAANGLNWCVGEMERRFRLMSAVGVRNLAGYNHKVVDAKKAGKPLTNPHTLTPEAPEPLDEMPLIVVVIDELADLMMVQGKKIEELIARLAQKARAAGIHLLLATQRPSVDVITGLIKANIPTRVAFQVSSKIDSRTILDQSGAESLLGQGDMLYLPPGTGYTQRVHGAYVTDNEVHAVVDHLKQQGPPAYEDGVLDPGAGEAEAVEGGDAGNDPEADPMYDQAVQIVLQSRRASISLVQRHLRIGYNRAARLIEQMEKAGLVSTMQTNGNREVLAPSRADA
ncbi:MAG: DNA translocase FtsK 4TM domain-containing protein [Betaproteobacteria bacterium]